MKGLSWKGTFMSDGASSSDSVPARDGEGTDRRRLLTLGAIGAASIVSIRPALAQTAGSVLNCEIPVPDAANRGKYIAADGTLVPAGTSGAYPPSWRAFKGQEVRQAMGSGGTLPYTDANRSRAYLNYIRRLQRGTSGFTCFASLQMPR